MLKIQTLKLESASLIGLIYISFHFMKYNLLITVTVLPGSNISVPLFLQVKKNKSFVFHGGVRLQKQDMLNKHFVSPVLCMSSFE